MHTEGHLARTRKMLAVLFMLFTVVLSIVPSVDLAAAHAQDSASPYIRAVFDEPRNASAPYEEVGDPSRLPALPAPQAPYLAAPGMTAYTELDTLFVIYTNTAAGTLNSTDVARLKDHANETARFLWRQSHFKFYMRLTFMVITTHKDQTEFTQFWEGAYWLNPTDDDGDGKSVEADLLARGVTANQYDSINYLWAHNNGNIPAAFGGLGGLIDWRLGETGITENPVFDASGSQKFFTAFPHEIQHTIDFMMESSGYSDYFHADRPWDFPGAFGEDWSFWEVQMKHWPVQNWLVLRQPWGDILETTDADSDGVPDSGPGLPITEVTLGSAVNLSDSDNDGFTDLNEGTAGLFRNANPKHHDTDGDFMNDGFDGEPLYPVNAKILKKNLALNGNPSGWDLLTPHLESTNTPFAPTMYANWNANYLFLMVKVDRFAGIHLMIDANADGWFHGKDNYFIAIDPSYPEPTDPLSIADAHIWDSSEGTIAVNVYPIWDDDPNYPFPRLITKESIGRYSRSDGDGFLTQIAIPTNAQTGLIPRHGKRIGLNIVYRDIARDGALMADTFEKNDFAYVTLWDTYATIAGTVGMPGATITALGSGTTSSVTSGQNGGYSLRVAQGWTGTVTPSHPCFNFNPPYHVYTTLSNNVPSANFTPVFNAASGCANVNVAVGGIHRGAFVLSPQTSVRTNFPSLNSAPVRIASSNGLPLVASERVIYKVNGLPTSFSELMALPNSQLDRIYWLPWYNNRDLDTQLRIGNVSNSTATVRIYIAGVEMPGSPFTIPPANSRKLSFPNVSNGPVKIISSVNVVASERVIYKVNGVPTSYSEMMALPEGQLDRIYWLPWYNGVNLEGQLRLANASASTATVRVYVRDVEMPGSPFTLAPETGRRVSFPGVNSGPVKIVSNVNIVASNRVIYKNNPVPASYSETIALPNRHLDKTYWLPWYNHNPAGLPTSVRFTNLSTGTATVHVYLAGVELPFSPFPLPPGAIYYRGFAGDSGPLKITSDASVLIDAQLNYSVNGIVTSYADVMALPNNQLDTIYWLPWYDNLNLDTQLRFGTP
jgi:hypothetical protein